MKKYFTYNAEGEVAMYSEVKNEVPEKFQQKVIEVSENDLEKIKNGWKPKIEHDKLVLEKTTKIEDEERKQLKERLREKLRDPKVQIKDIADLLINIL